VNGVLAKQYDMAKSMICTILKNKDALETADVTEEVTLLTKQRSQVLEEVEKLLLVWINCLMSNLLATPTTQFPHVIMEWDSPARVNPLLLDQLPVPSTTKVT
jgi:hypothetical protein